MKGQGGVEFLVYSALLVLLLSLFLFSSYSRQYELITLKINNEMKDLANNIAFEINEAVRAGDGYERKFYITASISNFNVTVGKYYISVEWGNGKTVYSNIITQNITGNFSKGFNKINNTKGVIYVN